MLLIPENRKDNKTACESFLDMVWKAETYSERKTQPKPNSPFPLDCFCDYHPKMASSTNPQTAGNEDKINFVFDISIMKSMLHTIHSSDLIHRQPTEARRSAYADTVSLLEHKVSKIEEVLKKRKCVGKRLQRILTCKDRDYDKFVALKNELREVYSDLMNNAR
jgi:hypothetical protein